MAFFCWSVPGKLISHSEFESCAARLVVFVSLRSPAVVFDAATSAAAAPSTS
jgi:hypothetical protein